MIVQDLIDKLEDLDPSLVIHAFGVNANGKFSVRPVTGAEAVMQKTRVEGSTGPIVLIQTAVYDR